MPASDYTSTGGGLKLKGAKNAGIDKKRKKKKSSSTAVATASAADKDTIPAQDPEKDGATDEPKSKKHSTAPDEMKTEAERKYDEVRRKRLEEKLRREGVKTHKERVEELNKYLSTLSEHHDMPRIGPG